jgi:hypothetical protein
VIIALQPIVSSLASESMPGLICIYALCDRWGVADLKHCLSGLENSHICLGELLRITFCREQIVVLHVLRDVTRGRHRIMHSGEMRVAVGDQWLEGVPTVAMDVDGDIYLNHF